MPNLHDLKIQDGGGRHLEFRKMSITPNWIELFAVYTKFEGQMHHGHAEITTHSLTAALDQLRVVASSTSNDPGPRSRQHQQIGQCLLPLAAANFSVNDPAGASSQQREECQCGLLLTVEVPAKQVCSPVGDRCVQIMNDVCQQ